MYVYTQEITRILQQCLAVSRLTSLSSLSESESHCGAQHGAWQRDPSVTPRRRHFNQTREPAFAQQKDPTAPAMMAQTVGEQALPLAAAAHPAGLPLAEALSAASSSPDATLEALRDPTAGIWARHREKSAAYLALEARAAAGDADAGEAAAAALLG
jgi:hypothetical protein